MNKEFVTYKQALALTKLGFVGPAMGLYYEKGKELYYGTGSFSSRRHENILAPLYSEAFKWFREEHNYAGFIQLVEPEYGGDYGYVIYYKLNHLAVDHWNKGFKTYEKAEQACLDKLIEIVKNGNTNN